MGWGQTVNWFLTPIQPRWLYLGKMGWGSGILFPCSRENKILFLLSIHHANRISFDPSRSKVSGQHRKDEYQINKTCQRLQWNVYMGEADKNDQLIKKCSTLCTV